MAPPEPFTFVEGIKDTPHESFRDYVDILSGKVADTDIQFNARLRQQYPEMIVTTVPSSNLNLIYFADLGYAHYETDSEHDPLIRWRGYVPPDTRHGGEGYLGEIISYAKYKYKFGEEYFILYYIKLGYTILQYILKEPRGESENQNTRSSETDKLLRAAGAVLYKQQPGIFVFDRMWRKDTALLKEVQKSTWDKVILDEKMKESLVQVSEKFFDSKKIYEDLGVAWKRGILFHGPPGNGKTISIKALMRTLSLREAPIPTLYVKSAPGTYYIGAVFNFARYMSPCLLVLEDVETIVTPTTRSYFFNEVDGLENNNGILTVASTNFLDRLDPGLSKRPSRFDRKYLFPLPNFHERELYTEFWRAKLKKMKTTITFPKKLLPAMARITDKFSFAYMQEAFVASLLDIARRDTDDPEQLVQRTRVIGFRDVDDDEKEGDPEDLDNYLLWRVFKAQVKILRENMDAEGEGQGESQSPMPIEDRVPNPAGPDSMGMMEPSCLDTPRGMHGDSNPFGSMVFGGITDVDRDWQAKEYLRRFDKYPQPNPAATEFRGLNFGMPWMRH